MNAPVRLREVATPGHQGCLQATDAEGLPLAWWTPALGDGARYLDSNSPVFGAKRGSKWTAEMLTPEYLAELRARVLAACEPAPLPPAALPLTCRTDGVGLVRVVVRAVPPHESGAPQWEVSGGIFPVRNWLAPGPAEPTIHACAESAFLDAGERLHPYGLGGAAQAPTVAAIKRLPAKLEASAPTSTTTAEA